MTDLEICRKVYDQAIEIATRWIMAWRADYTWVQDLKLNWSNNTITFTAQYSTPGIGFFQTLSMKYLEDATSLEEDSKKYWDKYLAERNSQITEMRELENNEAVQKYKRLCNYPLFPNNINCYSHLLGTSY